MPLCCWAQEFRAWCNQEVRGQVHVRTISCFSRNHDDYYSFCGSRACWNFLCAADTGRASTRVDMWCVVSRQQQEVERGMLTMQAHWLWESVFCFLCFWWIRGERIICFLGHGSMDGVIHGCTFSHVIARRCLPVPRGLGFKDKVPPALCKSGALQVRTSAFAKSKDVCRFLFQECVRVFASWCVCFSVEKKAGRWKAALLVRVAFRFLVKIWFRPKCDRLF